MVRHATLDELRDELSRGGVLEAALRTKGWHLDGYCDGPNGAIVINPQPHLVRVVLHELLHRRFPRWGETRVEAESRRMLSHMTDADVSTFHRAYRRLARKCRRPVTVDNVA